MVGQIVCEIAGRDRGKLSVIIGECGEMLLVCNGKSHRLKSPKRKNPKHLEFTNAFIKSERLNSDSSVRRALSLYIRTGQTE